MAPSLTVWKYRVPVTDAVYVEMPDQAEILHVGNQNPANISALEIWVRCDPTKPLRNRFIKIVGTGNPCGDEPHIGSVITAGGQLVWHVFDGGYR